MVTLAVTALMATAPAVAAQTLLEAVEPPAASEAAMTRPRPRRVARCAYVFPVRGIEAIYHGHLGVHLGAAHGKKGANLATRGRSRRGHRGSEAAGG